MVLKKIVQQRTKVPNVEIKTLRSSHLSAVGGANYFFHKAYTNMVLKKIVQQRTKVPNVEILSV